LKLAEIEHQKTIGTFQTDQILSCGMIVRGQKWIDVEIID
jgi:hypothetical protein